MTRAGLAQHRCTFDPFHTRFHPNSPPSFIPQNKEDPMRNPLALGDMQPRRASRLSVFDKGHGRA
jgi:hypothetical protein